MIRRADAHETRLPFPTKPLKIGNDVVEEYIIPDEKRQEVLEELYLFDPVPSLDEECFDLHEGKTFIVREFRVTWENGQNWLVSPYYPSSGGTVIDWLPADAAHADDDEDEDEDEDDEDEDDEGDLEKDEES